MKKTLFLLLLISNVLNAQLISNEEWALSAQGTSSSWMKSMEKNSNGDILSVGEFRRGNLSLGNVTYPELNQGPSTFVMLQNSNGNVSWIHASIHGAMDAVFLPGGNIMVLTSDSLHILNSTTGITMQSQSIVSTGAINFSGLSLLQNGNLLITGESFAPTFSLAAQTVNAPSSFVFAVQINSNFQIISQWILPYSGSPWGSQLQIAVQNNGVIMALNADAADRNVLMNNYALDPIEASADYLTLIVNWDLNTTSSIQHVLSSSDAGFDLQDLQVNDNNDYCLTANVYDRSGTGVFGFNYAGQTLTNGINRFIPLIVENGTILDAPAVGTDLLYHSVKYNDQGKIWFYTSASLAEINGMSVVSLNDTSISGSVYTETHFVETNFSNQISGFGNAGYAFHESIGEALVLESGFLVGGITINTSNDPFDEGKFLLRNVSLSTATSITQLEQNENYILFPNPSIHSFSIEGVNSDVSISIYDFQGKLLNEIPSWRNSDNRFGSELSAGCYLIQIKNQENVVTMKWIKNE